MQVISGEVGKDPVRHRGEKHDGNKSDYVHYALVRLENKQEMLYALKVNRLYLEVSLTWYSILGL